jgi:UPF0271 protein
LTLRNANTNKKALVLDTSAILSGFAVHMSDTLLFTTSEVLNELQSGKVESSSQVPLINEGSVRVLMPSETSIRSVNEAVDAAGEESLSGTDKSLIALALDLKNRGYEPVLVTDDYALQNSAEIMGLRFQPYVEKGITHRYRWRLICPGCFREYKFSDRMQSCPVCGTKLKKRVGVSQNVKRP